MEPNKFIRALEYSIADCNVQMTDIKKNKKLHVNKKLRHLIERIEALEDIIKILNNKNN